MLRHLCVSLLALAAPALVVAQTQDLDNIEQLRAALAVRPEDGAARLALALALLKAGDLNAARYHLELVVGADLPPEQKERALAELRRIREAATTGSVAINSLPPVRLRTVIDPDGTARTVKGDGSYGAGLLASGRLALGEDRRWFARGSVDWREYGGTLDDFVYSQASAGRVLRTEHMAYTLEAGALGALYQQRPWYSGALLQAGATYYPRADVTWFNTLLLRRIAFTELPGASTTQAYLFVDRRQAQPGSSSWTVGGTLGTSQAEDRWRRFSLGELRASALHEFRGGWIVEGRVAGGLARFAAPEPGFQDPRRDLSGVVGLDVTWRERTLWGLAPRFSVAYTAVNSNLDFYDSRRGLVGVGLTSNY